MDWRQDRKLTAVTVLCTKLLVLIAVAQADVFTSMSDMHTLLYTEGELIRTVETYIAAQEARLHRLRRFVKFEKCYNYTFGIICEALCILKMLFSFFSL